MRPTGTASSRSSTAGSKPPELSWPVWRLWLKPFSMDLKFAIRQFFKNPGFTLVAVLTLGFGIGANTAMFSFVNAWIIRPLPYTDPDRLVILNETNKKSGVPGPVAPADFKDWREQATAFQELAAYSGEMFNLTGGDEPVQVGG